MDLLRALDVLSTSSNYDDSNNNNFSPTQAAASSREKIEACRTIAEQICSPSIRNTTDFPRFLSVAISLLLRVHGDKDLNVYSVAEESLNRTIKVLIYTQQNSERIIFELFRVIKGQSKTTQTGGTTSSLLINTQTKKQNDASSVLSSPAPSATSTFTPTPSSSSSSSSSPSTSSTSLSSSSNVLSTASVILSKPFPLKSQRIALVKFGEVCHFIRPNKCRKYITSLAAPINHLLRLTNDESLQDTIAGTMEPISRILMPHLKEGEVKEFIEYFIPNLYHSSAAVRRSASFSIISIVRHYPKSLYLGLIDILSVYQSPTATGENNRLLGILFTYLQMVKLAEEWTGQDVNLFTSRVQYFLQFIGKHSLRMAMSNDPTNYDHNVVGAGLELLQQMLSSFGKYDYCWPLDLLQPILSQLHLLASFKKVEKSDQSSESSTPSSSFTPLRVGMKAVVISSLAQIVKYFPKLFFDEFYKDQQPIPTSHQNLTVSDISFKLFNISDQSIPTNDKSSSSPTTLGSSTSTLVLDSTPKEEFLQYLNDSDPLLRGSTALLIGCLVRGFLKIDHINSNGDGSSKKILLQDFISIPYLMAYLLRSLLDQSSITAKLACTGIGECLSPISKSSRCSEWALVALRHLLCVSSSTYWLVKLEILDTLSHIDYVIIEYLEQNIQHKSHILSIANQQQQSPINNSGGGGGNGDSGGAVSIPIQTKVLGFLIEQLGDNDYRVRNSAGNSLVNIIPNLVFTAPLERHSMKALASNIRKSFDVLNNDHFVTNKNKIQSNLSHVIGLIINQLSNPHPEDMIRGCYHALKLIASIYSFPVGTTKQCRTLGSTLANPMLMFVGDILPLALDRVGIITWMATDFDLHIDIIDTIGFLARGAESVLGSYCHNVLRHLCRIVNIMSNILQFRPTPPLKETKPNTLSNSGIVNSPSLIKTSSTHPGAFTHSIHYIKIYAKLLQVRTNSMTVLSVGPTSSNNNSNSNNNQPNSASSDDSDKFSQLRQSCLDSLSVIIKCSGKSIVPFAEEITGYLFSHFEQEPLATCRCITELFLVSFKPTPLISMSNSTINPNRLSRDLTNIGKLYEPRSVDVDAASTTGNQHDELFSNNKSIFASFLLMGNNNFNNILKQHYEPVQLPGLAHSLNYTYSNQEVNRILLAEDKKSLYRHFEPLFASFMLEYRTTHQVELKKEILSMFSKFSRFGLDLSMIDKDQQLLPFILDEIKETNCLLSQSSQLLPYMFDLFGNLVVNRKLFNDIINIDDLKKILPIQINNQQQNNNNHNISSSSNIIIILKSIQSFIKYLFDVNDKYGDQEFRDQILKFIMEHLYLEEAVDLCITLLQTIKSNNNIHLKYSQTIANRVFNCLALSETPYFIVESIESIKRLYSLVDHLHPNSVTATRWCDALLSASPSFVQSPQSHLKNDPLQRRRVLGINEELLEYNELRWLPPLLILLRTGVKIPEETRISTARQSLYLSHHDNKQVPSPSANIISLVLFKLIRNAVNIYSQKKPNHKLPSLLINHLLYFAGLFFNKNLIPTISQQNNSNNNSSTSPILGSQTNSLLSFIGRSNSNNNLLSTSLFLSSIRSCIEWNYFEEIGKNLITCSEPSTALHGVRFLMLLAPSKMVDAWFDYSYSSNWTKCDCEHFLTHHVIFLMYCQFAIVHKLPIHLSNSSFMDKIVLLINEGTTRKLIDTVRNVGNNMDLLTKHLKMIFSNTNPNSLDLRKKQKLLRLLSYLPANRESIELLITNFLQTDDISLQIAAERILNLHLNTLIDTYGATDSKVIIENLYEIFMSNFYKSTTNLSTQSLFIKLIKNLSLGIVEKQGGQIIKNQQELDNLELLNLIIKNKEIKDNNKDNKDNKDKKDNNNSLESINYEKFIDIIKRQYYKDSHHAFNQLSILSQIDRNAMKQLLLSSHLDITLLPTFITSPLSADYQQELLDHTIKRIDKLLSSQLSDLVNDPLKSGPPLLTDSLWEELNELLRTVATYINRFGSLVGVDDQKLLRLAIWSFVEGFRRWRAQVINPYDFKIILELTRSIILSSQASILTITDDFSWCSLLLCLYKFYCLVIRPHFGFIQGQRELEENYSQDPTQISLTQSNEMVKFLVSLLNSSHLCKPTSGSHIGQFIFDSFMRTLIPLAEKAVDFIYPTVEIEMENEKEIETERETERETEHLSSYSQYDEFGGGIIPNCPLFSNNQFSPEYNLRAFVRYVDYVGLDSSAERFDQIWQILEPIFMAPLGDADVGYDEITEESKCVALHGITNMIIKACFEIKVGNEQINLLETVSFNDQHTKRQFLHTPREKDLPFLGTNSGRKASRLESIIYSSLPQSELPLERMGECLDIPTKTNASHTSSAVPISPYHFNIERGWNSLNRFTSGQLSLADLKQFKSPYHLGINFTPIIEKLLQTFEAFLINSMCPPMLRKEIINTTVLLSDLFNREQILWMYRIFCTMYHNTTLVDDNDDFLLKQHLVLGICKSIAIIYPNDLTSPLSPYATLPPKDSGQDTHANTIFDILSSALEHKNLSLQQSALDSILYLLEGKVNRYIHGPLIQFLFRWIPSRLTMQPLPPVGLILRVLAVMFIIIEQYSREAEENSFTKKAVYICTSLGQMPSTPLPIVYGIFRGFDRLLVSFSLSHSQREYISQFALKSLPLDNPIRSLLGLGLMVTCMYTGDETSGNAMTPSINTNSKNSMMSSPPTTPTTYTPSESPLSFSNNDLFNNGAAGMDDDETLQYSQINNMEKVKMLFDKVKNVSHYTFESFILSEVIPTIIVDIYPSVDQILSFILGEFLKQSKSNPKLMCQIVSNVFKLLVEKEASNRQLIYYWITICLQNFFQIQNQVHCKWALTVLFLCSSPLKSLQLLSIELSSKIQSYDQLFIIAASEFYSSKYLSPDIKKLFIDSFSKLKTEPFVSLLSTLTK
ncbi:Huntingtin family protein [Cavenderia fasciculata]|uniref:Huntingtin family protein n=1 Tax=Cavenderia fasciculata TaxID=261658 RepID=F4Q6B1_CACFS|nr:Huntingtin family protein [Cavenderia fasciculata]EGG16421.1 Huntingtin family protein [Cavenderia fasciculata]|eukprot:XP_004354821.1 Huntingtin family protein [Cavenderia fasciculata]